MRKPRLVGVSLLLAGARGILRAARRKGVWGRPRRRPAAGGGRGSDRRWEGLAHERKAT